MKSGHGQWAETVIKHQNMKIGSYIDGKGWTEDCRQMSTSGSIHGPHPRSTFCINHLTFSQYNDICRPVWFMQCFRSFLLLLVCGHFGVWTLWEYVLQICLGKGKRDFRTLQLFIMHCWLLSKRNVSVRKVMNSLREFTRCSFISKNILTLNVLLAWTRQHWILQHHHHEHHLVFCL